MKKGRNIGRTPKYTPERFALYYPKHKASGLTQMQIAEKMGVSYTTLKHYLKDPRYLSQSNDKMPTEKLAIKEEAKSRADQIIDAGYGLHAFLIKHYKDKGDMGFQNGKESIGEMNYEKAAEFAIKALKVCDTETDIKRVFAAIQVNVDNRQQSVNVGGDCQRCSQEIIKIIMASVDDKTLEKVVEAIDRSKTNKTVLNGQGVI